MVSFINTQIEILNLNPETLLEPEPEEEKKIGEILWELSKKIEEKMKTLEEEKTEMEKIIEEVIEQIKE